MSETERKLHRSEMADIYIATAERYEHSAIFLHPNPGSFEEILRLIDLVRERSGYRYFLMLHGDATYGMPGGGYIFSTSNCAYTGMALRRYELILDVWRREGNYA